MNQEYKDLAKLIKQINKNIAKHEEEQKYLPSGTIFVRKINNKSYVYRNKKMDGKTKSNYLGCLSDPEVKKEIEKSKQYKKNIVMIRKLKQDLNKICKKINSKTQKGENLTEFAININRVDGLEPSNKAKALLKLLEHDVIDLETYEFAIDRIYSHA